MEKINGEESKYLRMFQNVDLSSNFYFSFTYDLSHTLQYNLSSLNCGHNIINKEGGTIWENQLQLETGPSLDHESIRTLPNYKFVWNDYLLQNVHLHPDWLLYIIHGFVCQSNICVFGKPIYLTLIARRSKKFAGTRFLKRGANYDGDVANEVETEQIVFDASVSSLTRGRYTSFVQMRGSISSHWSQDTSKMVAKPAIVLDSIDPYFSTAGLHFNELLYRYGSPIVVFNLVKKSEQKPHESVLCKEVRQSIEYLNQFLPSKYSIQYIGLDMARISKARGANVMSTLTSRGYQVLKRIGIFQNWIPSSAKRSFQIEDKIIELGGVESPCGRIFQTGVVRVNCVDCLDRTNTAQFMLGKCALSIQLYMLGVINKPNLEFDTDAVRMLEEIYEDHGDTLALQYGGSHLVHRIKSYRKIAPLSSHSRDIMQTLSRYYSNTFSDADKQDAMNLFLGIFRPSEESCHVWNLTNDFYLHNSKSIERQLFGDISKPATCWWDEKVARSLPRAACELYKGAAENILYASSRTNLDISNDGFFEQYRPQELTILSNTLVFEMSHTERHFMPNCTLPNEQSPFFVRQRPGKRKELTTKSIPPNPSVSGHVSTSSSSSSASEMSDDTSDDELLGESVTEEDDYSNSECLRYNSDSIDSEHIYGKLITPPKMKDIIMYKRYIETGITAGEYSLDIKDYESRDSLATQTINSTLTSICSTKEEEKEADLFSVKLVPPSATSLSIYCEYVNRSLKGASLVSFEDVKCYSSYLNAFS